MRLLGNHQIRSSRRDTASAVAQTTSGHTFTLHFTGAWAGISFSAQALSAACANSEPTASSGKDSGRFPWRFQSDCKGLRCSVHRPVYCRRRNSESLRALCYAWRGYWRVPACRFLR